MRSEFMQTLAAVGVLVLAIVFAFALLLPGG